MAQNKETAKAAEGQTKEPVKAAEDDNETDESTKAGEVEPEAKQPKNTQNKKVEAELGNEAWRFGDRVVIIAKGKSRGNLCLAAHSLA